jgi:hypothetical protein
MQSEYEAWSHGLAAGDVRRQFRDLGCDIVVIKVLRRNHNSKNQIRLAPHLNDLAFLPFGEARVHQGSSTKKGAPQAIFHCDIDFLWIGPMGVAAAPEAKLAYHPQYPEVRLSGVLRGCPAAPSHLLRIDERGSEAGRVLLLGVNRQKGTVHGLLVGAAAPLAGAIRELNLEQRGSLLVWPLDGPAAKDLRRLILKDLCEVSRGDWHTSQRLTATGLVPYVARNAGGTTLEALLGIIANSRSAPDKHGHEIKALGVSRLERPRAVQVTLVDTAPDSGEYQNLGPAGFVRRHGHRNPERFDFTGTHRIGKLPPRTGARLEVMGYDDRHLRADGAVALIAGDGTVLMQWSFEKLIDHWSRKHALAVYVPSERRMVETAEGPARQYRYGNVVQVAAGTSFTRFLDALVAGTICYDPGMSATPVEEMGPAKIRNLFRISSRNLSCLYDEFLTIDTCSPPSTAGVEDGGMSAVNPAL